MSSTAIKISSSLAEKARPAAAASHRSLTGQVEYWASLGSRVEPHFTVSSINALHQSNGDLSKIEDQTERTRILETLEVLRKTPPHGPTKALLSAAHDFLYEADPNDSSAIVQVSPDGTRTKGEFINRVFTPQQ